MKERLGSVLAYNYSTVAPWTCKPLEQHQQAARRRSPDRTHRRNAQRCHTCSKPDERATTSCYTLSNPRPSTMRQKPWPLHNFLHMRTVLKQHDELFPSRTGSRSVPRNARCWGLARRRLQGLIVATCSCKVTHTLLPICKSFLGRRRDISQCGTLDVGCVRPRVGREASLT